MYSQMNAYQEARISHNVFSITENDKFGEHPLMYLIAGDEKSALIDTGVDTADLNGFIKERFADKETDNLIIINTHTHYDHVGANHRFPNSPIYVSSFDQDFVADKSLNMAEAAGFELKDFKVTHWADDGEKIPLSTTDPENYLEILHTPGHSPDSLTVWYPADGRLFVGDLAYRKLPVICFTPKSDINVFSASVKKVVKFIDEKEASGAGTIHLSSGHVDTNFESDWLRKFSVLMQDAIDGKIAGSKRHDPRFTNYSTPDGMLSIKHAEIYE